MATTPFILWLSKLEVDEMLSTLINAKSDKLLNNDISQKENLVVLSQNLLKQNRDLIKLIEKIEPLNPLHKRSAHIYGVDQKCKHYNAELKKMSTHCSIYSNKLENKFQEFSESICEECSRKSKTDYLDN